MKFWFKKNIKTIVTLSFIIPIVIVAIVSISHVTQWYTLSNPITWAVYLSVGIEMAALSALSAISVNMGKKVYLPFIIVTLIQLIGNIYFSYMFIDVNSLGFKSWVELTSPLMEFIGVEPSDLLSHKRVLSFFSGGMLPMISLSFLHMLVKFSEENKIPDNVVTKHTIPEKPKIIQPVNNPIPIMGGIEASKPKSPPPVVSGGGTYDKKNNEITKEDLDLVSTVIEQPNQEKINENPLPINKENLQRKYSKYTYGNGHPKRN